MARELVRRMARLELAEETAWRHRLTATKRPRHLPDTPAATWDAAELAELGRFVREAQMAGARRPLGWMRTEDLLALNARLADLKPKTESGRPH